jgi:glycosyltransferase involved in cell wall biosynthesis
MSIAISVVVPVHNEGALLAGNLRRMLEGEAGRRIDLIVVANGCTDDSAAIARSVSPRVRVVEIPQPSKIAALNAGDATASVYPRAYVDADVRISSTTLLALAQALPDDGVPRVAAPRLVVDTGGSAWAVRQYFRAWMLSSYHADGHVGSGVYALSRAGRQRFGTFPDVIADDRFVQLQFSPEERIQLSGHEFAVPAPRTLAAQVARNTRILAGNRQLVARAGTAAPTSSGHGELLARAVRRPASWPGVAVYSYAYAAARIRARRALRRGGEVAWSRDETTRA